MTKGCSFCQEPFIDGEAVRVVVDTTYKEIPSKISYALSRNMTIVEIYHRECYNYCAGGGK